mmetsp:Transcript_51323/g.109128  ORF Transcript_51323/g.109128 Transcript_51323/m.109128 type:complete len:384 (-) Transcript_51323:277-1428(-)
MVLLGSRGSQHMHGEAATSVFLLASAAAAVATAAAYTKLLRKRGEQDAEEDGSERYKGLLLLRDPDEREPEEEPDAGLSLPPQGELSLKLYWLRAAWDRRQSQNLPEPVEALIRSFIDEPAGWRRMLGSAADTIESSLKFRSEAAAAAAAATTTAATAGPTATTATATAAAPLLPAAPTAAATASRTASGVPPEEEGSAWSIAVSSRPEVPLSPTFSWSSMSTSASTTAAATTATATATAAATLTARANPLNFPVPTAGLKDFLSALKEVQSRLDDPCWVHGRRALLSRLALRVEELRLQGAFDAFAPNSKLACEGEGEVEGDNEAEQRLRAKDRELIAETFTSVGALLRCALAELWEDRDYVGGRRPRRAGGRVAMHGIAPL